ncbi:hypothetical protein DCS_00371 [Drechmeria coniospora]|uniref:Calmodulin n=1 Tax=Drechmeria coniospora TaxID=98403 RepID=A0A151GQA8_DRECN|nr:hypothetical protein DCS_00371 [Drechmeria coniospora]KYK59241.1 hypothetical protein DCS_00371 [Drechmeria coniospora]
MQLLATDFLARTVVIHLRRARQPNTQHAAPEPPTLCSVLLCSFLLRAAAPRLSFRLCTPRNAAASTNYKEAFALFDKRGNGRVTVDSLGDLLRACGQNPTLAEIQELEKNAGSDFDFESFQRILNRPGGFREPGEPEEYCRGFQVFDKDMTGFIGVGQLKYILTNLGEKMTDEEVDELLKAVDTSSGQVNYTASLLAATGRGANGLLMTVALPELVRTILAN